MTKKDAERYLELNQQASFTTPQLRTTLRLTQKLQGEVQQRLEVANPTDQAILLAARCWLRLSENTFQGCIDDRKRKR